MSRKFLLAWAFLGALLLVVPVPTRAADEKKMDIVGTYAVEGANPGGGVYRGTATITKQGGTYLIDWLIGTNDAHSGIGLVQGNTYSAAYASDDIAGIVVYRIEQDKLVGQWAIAGGNGQVLRETLTRK